MDSTCSIFIAFIYHKKLREEIAFCHIAGCNGRPERYEGKSRIHISMPHFKAILKIILAKFILLTVDYFLEQMDRLIKF